MTDKERVKDVPHYNLICENETIHLRSLFDFKGGCDELFPFLYGCSVMNCTVVFENENITIFPDDKENKVALDLRLSIYMMVAQNDKLVKDYINYLCLLNQSGALEENGSRDSTKQF